MQITLLNLLLALSKLHYWRLASYREESGQKGFGKVGQLCRYAGFCALRWVTSVMRIPGIGSKGYLNCAGRYFGGWILIKSAIKSGGTNFKSETRISGRGV